MEPIYTAGLVVLRDRKVLLAFSMNKKAWYLPGGKTMNGESAVETLVREIKEELDITLDEKSLRFYMHISALAFGEKNHEIMEQECFSCQLDETPCAAGEIQAIRYFDSGSYYKEPVQVPGVRILLEKLKKDNLIN
jgi:8-oxo-dGTP pyrophosphatase MutT (NUDIX family)